MKAKKTIEIKASFFAAKLDSYCKNVIASMYLMDNGENKQTASSISATAGIAPSVARKKLEELIEKKLVKKTKQRQERGSGNVVYYSLNRKAERFFIESLANDQ